MLINTTLYYLVTTSAVIYILNTVITFFAKMEDRKQARKMNGTQNFFTVALARKDDEIAKLNEFVKYLQTKNTEYKETLSNMVGHEPVSMEIGKTH